MSPELITTLALGVPSLVIAVLTWWESRKMTTSRRGDYNLCTPNSSHKVTNNDVTVELDPENCWFVGARFSLAKLPPLSMHNSLFNGYNQYLETSLRPSLIMRANSHDSSPWYPQPLRIAAPGRVSTIPTLTYPAPTHRNSMAVASSRRLSI